MLDVVHVLSRPIIFSRKIVQLTIFPSDSDDLDDDRDINPIDPSRLELNPHGQSLHSEEDALRGKLAIDVPAFTVHDLYMIRVCSKVRQYLMDDIITGENVNHKFRKAVIKMARFCFLHEGKLYKKRRGIIREVCDSYKLRREALISSHDGTAHRGIENMLLNLASEELRSIREAEAVTEQRKRRRPNEVPNRNSDGSIVLSNDVTMGINH